MGGCRPPEKTQAAGTVYACKLEIEVTISWFTCYEIYSVVQQYLYVLTMSTYGILPLSPKLPLMDKILVTSYMRRTTNTYEVISEGNSFHKHLKLHAECQPHTIGTKKGCLVAREPALYTFLMPLRKHS